MCINYSYILDKIISKSKKLYSKKIYIKFIYFKINFKKYRELFIVFISNIFYV